MSRRDKVDDGFVGTCSTCRKRLYRTRAAAKRIARQHHEDHKSPYPCPEITEFWHVGHLGEQVVRGEETRSSVYGGLVSGPVS